MFISLVVFEAFSPASAPVDTSGNVCKQFLIQAICDKDRTPSAEAPEDRIVRDLLHPEGTGGEAPWRQPNQTVKEKDRNPEQQPSYSGSGPDPEAPAAAGSAPEQALPEAEPLSPDRGDSEPVICGPERLSPLSDLTAQPPSSDVPSPGSETHQ